MMTDVTIRYASDKPKDCAYCYFWEGKRKGCGISPCYYQVNEPDEPRRDETGELEISCEGCPYGRASPCIGYCIRKLLIEMRAKQ